MPGCSSCIPGGAILHLYLNSPITSTSQATAHLRLPICESMLHSVDPALASSGLLTKSKFGMFQSYPIHEKMVTQGLYASLTNFMTGSVLLS